MSSSDVDEAMQWAKDILRADSLCGGMQSAVDDWTHRLQRLVDEAYRDLLEKASAGHAGWQEAIASFTHAINRAGTDEALLLALCIFRAKVNSGRRHIYSVCSCYVPTDDDFALDAAALANRKTPR